jgi:hypothetical protein
VIDPGKQIGIGDVSDKQKEAKGGLVEVAVPQRSLRNRTPVDKFEMAADTPGLVVAAVLVGPVTVKEMARWVTCRLTDLLPGYSAVSLKVRLRDSV